MKYLKLLVKRFPKQSSSPLFSTENFNGISYSMFLKKFKMILARAGVVGDLRTHSLRIGGATFMSLSGCTVTEIKARGGWKSDCVYRYIRNPISNACKIDKNVASKV